MGLSTSYTVCTDYLKVLKIPPWESIFYQGKKVKYGKFFKKQIHIWYYETLSVQNEITFLKLIEKNSYWIQISP